MMYSYHVLLSSRATFSPVPLLFIDHLYPNIHTIILLEHTVLPLSLASYTYIYMAIVLLHNMIMPQSYVVTACFIWKWYSYISFLMEHTVCPLLSWHPTTGLKNMTCLLMKTLTHCIFAGAACTPLDTHPAHSRCRACSVRTHSPSG